MLRLETPFPVKLLKLGARVRKLLATRGATRARHVHASAR